MMDNTTRLSKLVVDDFSGYAIPGHVHHSWKGQTLDGKSVTVDMEIPLTNLLDKIDVLSELPYLVKKFVQTFVTAPYVYQWFQEVEARVVVDGQERVLHGKVFHENTFLMELSPEVPGRTTSGLFF